MEYRIDKQGLLDRISAWDGFLKRKVHLIACGGTAMTLLGVKASTKDIDLLVPNEDEHKYLVDILKQLGYKSASGWGWSRDDGFIFDLFRGNSIHTTQLLESPLKEGNHTLVKEFSHIYLGILNYYDIIISKLFRGSATDNEDCLALLKAKKSGIDLIKLEKQFREAASYDVSKEFVIKNWDHFLRLVKKEIV
ncbi:MAG: hypothetical protein KKC39_03355 [Candidatus Omnitrophica bacterium]|nr:hypothetical protein [Candidatus Omnitrophota bacterium]MBU4303297.1 hypothetical protein [Candidatus Omnitrophota bacterium]MBU4418406.1 hypothetical protein [Candidatus Omnitrophota bacterium]MBU4467766.1 hypothetical protein [Candidatus Omnitrophota bacterium]MCG2708039.1 hypothetical protein [Candidatus Omnitrophota bacterium]